jgi:hypothetical protein
MVFYGKFETEVFNARIEEREMPDRTPNLFSYLASKLYVARNAVYCKSAFAPL